MELPNAGSSEPSYALLTFFSLKWSSQHVLTHVVFLRQIEQFPDLGRAFRSQSTRNSGIGQAGNILFTFLYDDQTQNRQICVYDAAANRFSLSLTRSSRTIARMALAQQQTDALIRQNALLHRKALLVVSTADTEDISLPLIAQRCSIDFLRQTFIVENANFLFIFEVKDFLTTGSGIRYV